MTLNTQSSIWKLLNSKLRKALEDVKFTQFTPVQQLVLPVLLKKFENIIALAQTGSGKTAAYAIPILNNIANNIHAKSIIITPTRELCIQVKNVFESLSNHMNVKITAVYGGDSISLQRQQLEKKPDIVVATPGRLIDFMSRRSITIKEFQNIVIDEADKMFNMGFIEEITTILQHLSNDNKIMLFSATMPDELYATVQRYVKITQKITVDNANKLADNIDNIMYVAHANDKYKVLKRILNYHPDMYGIIFCRNKITTQQLTRKLITEGYNVDAIHGDLTQEQRNTVMRKFRSKNINILIATDLIARGIDVENITYVVHYDVAESSEKYIHRSGRTARAGKKGMSISISNIKEQYVIQHIAEELQITFTRKTIPSNLEIVEQQLKHFISKIISNDTACPSDTLDELLNQKKQFVQHITKENLIKRIISMEFSRLSNVFTDNEDLNVANLDIVTKNTIKTHEATKTSIEQAVKASTNGFVKIRIDIGRNTGTVPARIITLINDTVHHKVKIGKIDIYEDYSVIEIEAAFATMVFDEFAHRHDDRYHLSV